MAGALDITGNMPAEELGGLPLAGTVGHDENGLRLWDRRERWNAANYRQNVAERAAMRDRLAAASQVMIELARQQNACAHGLAVEGNEHYGEVDEPTDYTIRTPAPAVVDREVGRRIASLCDYVRLRLDDDALVEEPDEYEPDGNRQAIELIYPTIWEDAAQLTERFVGRDRRRWSETGAPAQETEGQR